VVRGQSAAVASRGGAAAVERRAVAVSTSGRDGWTEASGELREFLHRERSRSRAHVQRCERPCCARNHRNTISGSDGDRNTCGGSRVGAGNAALPHAAAAGDGDRLSRNLTTTVNGGT